MPQTEQIWAVFHSDSQQAGGPRIQDGVCDRLSGSGYIAVEDGASDGGPNKVRFALLNGQRGRLGDEIPGCCIEISGIEEGFESIVID